MIGLTILGSTGSIGVNTLAVMAQHPGRFELIAITANKNISGLLEQCLIWQPRYAVMADVPSAEKLQAALKQDAPDVTVLSGEEGLQAVAGSDETDYVMAAIVGGAGLLPTLTAAQKGKRVLLANKESLVMSGGLFMDAVRENGAELLPVDSEHNAVFQCMPADFQNGLQQSGVRRILLTASGGPFRTRALDDLEDVTPDEACAHPNWNMGRKISVDSATMMNKGLEIIEARWLFNAAADQIDVVIHPQSVIHSLVEYADGSVIAQLGNPDMRIPIAHAMAWPGRMESGVKKLNLFDMEKLSFEIPELKRFPCLGLARQALEAGGTATAVLNAANEIAVEAFLAGQIQFARIARIVEKTLADVTHKEVQSLDCVLSADDQARHVAMACCREMAA